MSTNLDLDIFPRYIWIPGHPPAELSPNARAHYMAKASMTAVYRQVCCSYTQDQRNLHRWQPWEVSRINLLFCYFQRRRRDYPNCLGGVKALMDGIVDAGIIPDDDSEHLKLGAIEIITGVRDEGVLIRLDRLEGRR